MNNHVDFEKDLIHIKFLISKFLVLLFLVVGWGVVVVYLVKFLLHLFVEKQHYDPVIYIFTITTLIATPALTYAYFEMTVSNYRKYLMFVLGSLLFTAMTTGALNGIGNYTTAIFLLFTVIITSIVIGIKTTLALSILESALIILITLLHLTDTVSFQPEESDSEVGTIFLIVASIWCIFYISKLGYGQIEESYNKALLYSKQLETLNKNLDKEVRDRTVSMQSNFEKQIETMQSSAMIGHITQPLLHDIATPLSTLKGALGLAEEDNDSSQEMIELAKETLQKIEAIIEDSKNLMRGKNLLEEFSVNKSIETVIKILNSELHKYEISLNMNIKKNFEIKGIKSLFERILLNLLINAIEELKQVDRARNLSISVLQETSQTLSICIIDNGRGIKHGLVEKIFDEDFSLKKNIYNFGLGLSFVKKTMMQNFQGDIVVASKPQRTEFKLLFNKP